MRVEPTLVVLTEDAGTSGWKPVVACVQALCDRLIAGISWPRVRILPREDASQGVLLAVGANSWSAQTKKGHEARLNLSRYIANQLLGPPETPRIVFFHIDADRPWSDGPPDASENVKRFDQVLTNVRQQVGMALARTKRKADIEALMSQLHLLVPCTAIESWLYQNTEDARLRCAARGCAGRHDAQYLAWAQDRTRLDEVAHLKDRRDLHCLDDRDKVPLAARLPAAAMYAAGRSFRAAVDAASNDGALLNGLIGMEIRPITKG